MVVSADPQRSGSENEAAGEEERKKGTKVSNVKQQRIHRKDGNKQVHGGSVPLLVLGARFILVKF